MVIVTALALLMGQIAVAQSFNSIQSKLLERQGRHFISKIFDINPFSRDLQLVTYINNLSETLAKNANINHEPLRYYVLEDPKVNAFAALGGTFFVNTGLVSLANTEGELAFVIAHELAHHQQEHLLRLLDDSKVSTATSLLSMLVGLAVGGDEGFALIAAGQASSVEAMIDHTLSYEREADAVGLRILLASNYHPKHAINFMKGLQKSIHQGGKVQATIHNTHPVTQERIASFEARSIRYQQVAKDHSSTDFYFAKARILSLTSTQPHRIENSFKLAIEKTKGVYQLANRYGYALSLLRVGKLDRASQEFQNLIQQYPKNLWLVLGSAETKIQQGLYTQASQILESYLSDSEPNPAVVEKYTYSLLHSGQTEKAYQFIRRHISKFLKYEQLHKLLAKVAHENGDLFNAYYAESEYYYQLGKLKLALNHLHNAEQNAKDHYSSALASAKRKSLDDELRWRRAQL